MGNKNQPHKILGKATGELVSLIIGLALSYGIYIFLKIIVSDVALAS